ncbi:MAG: helix-turn-helix domain-containing protein [Azospirillaceae bacterium]|nr:helix-turn-helix domain-containing protein [Azospirillaceae bacterium]
MNDRLPNRIRELREARGMTQEELGMQIGTDKTVISKLESGRTRLSQQRMVRIAASLGCGVAELLGMEEGRTPAATAWGQEAPEPVAEINIHRARHGGGMLADSAAAPFGASSLREDGPDAVWGFPSHFLRAELQVRPDTVRLIEVVGDGMEPTLLPGDRVMIDLADNAPSSDGIFALWDGEGVAIRRLEMIAGSNPPMVEIRFGNPRYKDHQRAAADIDIMGRVVWLGRRL